MEPELSNPRKADRLGVVYGTLGILAGVASVWYDFFTPPATLLNLIACVLLQRSKEGIWWARACLIAALLGPVIGIACPTRAGNWDTYPIIGMSRLSSLVMMFYFSTLGVVKKSDQEPEVRLVGRGFKPLVARFKRLHRNWQVLWYLLGCALCLEIAFLTMSLLSAYLAFGLFIAASCTLFYGVALGVGQEVFQRRGNDSGPSDDELPSV